MTRWSLIARPPRPRDVTWFSCLTAVNGGRTLYVLTPRGVARIDPATRHVGRPIVGTGRWYELTVTPGGHTAYLADPWSGSHTGMRGSIVPVTLRTRRVGAPIPVPGGAVGVAVAPGGRTAYAVTSAGAQLTPIDLTTRTAGPPITVAEGVSSLVITSRGRTAYVAGDDNMGVGDGVTYSFVTPIDLATGVVEAPFRYRHAPADVAVSPDGRTIYLTGGVRVGPPKPPAVWEADAANGHVTGTLRVPGGAAASIAVAPR